MINRDEGLDWTNKGIVDAIDRLNKSTTRLSCIMITLSIIVVILTGVLVWLTLFLIK